MQSELRPASRDLELGDDVTAIDVTQPVETVTAAGLEAVRARAELEPSPTV